MHVYFLLVLKILVTSFTYVNTFLQIHLGRGIWIPKIKFNEASNSNSPSIFVKTICDMVFTPDELKHSTVSGKPTNRSKSDSRKPNKLDPTKILSIKGIFTFYQYLEILFFLKIGIFQNLHDRLFKIMKMVLKIIKEVPILIFSEFRVLFINFDGLKFQ